MLGRTHGQPGLPITFGFKAAVWAAECARHLERLAQARPRLAVVQLAGAVGTLSSAGAVGPVLQERFAARLGLGRAGHELVTARDRVAEFVTLLALVTGTFATDRPRGDPAQRPEIGELREAAQRRRRRQHHDASEAKPRAVRAPGHARRRGPRRAVPAFEGLVGEHERDGAAWKTEWSFLPTACTATAASLRLGASCSAGCGSHRSGCARTSTPRTATCWPSRRCSRSRRGSASRAHSLVSRAARAGSRTSRPAEQALTADPAITALLSAADLAALLRPERTLGAIDLLIDGVVAAACPGTGRPTSAAP